MKRLVAVGTIALLLASVTVQFVPFDFQNQIAFAQESGVSVAVELIKKNVVMAVIKNNGEAPVYDVRLDGHDSGTIVYVKAEGWARERIDASSIRLSTEDRAIQPGHSMRILLLVKNIDPTYTLEWTAAGSNLAIVTKGALEVNAIMVSLPQDCTAARDQVSRLLDELSADVPDDVERLARDYVARDPQADTTAEAWDNLAAAAMLKGDLYLSAWVGLNSVKAEWSPLHITNAAIYLTNIGKDPEALQLLNCAYGMGYRSAYLFEALATIYDGSGDGQKANEYITQAQQLAPDDPILEVESALMSGGSPPLSSVEDDRSSERMAILNQAYEELEAHIKDVSSRRWQHNEYVLQIFPDRLHDVYDSGGRIRVSEEVTQSILENYNPKQNKLWADEFGEGLTLEEYHAFADSEFNNILARLIELYIHQTGLSIGLRSAPAYAPIFWSKVIQITPEQIITENASPNWEKHLAQGAEDEFTDAFWDAQSKHASCGVSQAELRSKYEAFASQAESRYNLAASSFDVVAKEEMELTEKELSQARDYVTRYVNAMRVSEIQGDDSEVVSEEKAYQQEARDRAIKYYQGLVEYNLDPAVEFGGGTAKWLSGEARNYLLSKKSVLYSLEHWSSVLLHEGGVGSPFEDCQLSEDEIDIQDMTEEEYQAYLAELLQRMAGDIDSDASGTLDCNVSIGPVSLSANFKERKTSVSWDWGAGDTPLDHEPTVTLNPDRTVSIEIEPKVKRSIEVDGKSGGVAVEGGITVSQRFDEVRVHGKGGIGVGAADLSAACYVVEVSSTIKARSVLETAWQYLEADARRN